MYAIFKAKNMISIELCPSIVDEEVALLAVANVDELPARLRRAVIAGQACKLDKGPKKFEVP